MEHWLSWNEHVERVATKRVKIGSLFIEVSCLPLSHTLTYTHEQAHI